MKHVIEAVRPDLPDIRTPLPGPNARRIIDRDAKVLSPSYTRGYPLVVERGEGAIVEDVDGNRFLDFNAGIAVVATGHCHAEVVRAIDEADLDNLKPLDALNLLAELKKQIKS